MVTRVEIKVATEYDKEFVMCIDKHMDDTVFANRVYTKSGYAFQQYAV